MSPLMKRAVAVATGCLALTLACGFVSSPAFGAANVTLSVVYYYTSEVEKDFVQKMLDEWYFGVPHWVYFFLGMIGTSR